MKFDPRLFTDVFWKLRKAAHVPYWDAAQQEYATHRGAFPRLVVNYGSAASSKSYSQAQHEVLLNYQRPRSVTLIMRKVGATLKDSVIPLVLDEVLPQLDLWKFYHYNKSDRILTHKRTKSRIIFRGLDKAEKIKSIQGVTRWWFEEATEGEEGDIKQLNIRIRGRPQLQGTLTFNPVDETHWCVMRYILPDRPPAGVAVLKSTFRDNPWIVGPYFFDWGLLRELVTYKQTDPEFFQVYGEGMPGKLTRGAEFYKTWSAKNTCPSRPRNADEPLHVTFDENVHPWLTCNIWQAADRSAWQIDELHLRPPQNTLTTICRQIADRHPPTSNRILFMYGDPSSRKQDVKLEPGATFYSLAHRYLTDYGFEVRDRVQLAAPSVSLRGSFINDVFADGFGGRCQVHICRHCEGTIADYRYVKEAMDGTKFKAKVTDPVHKVRYEPWGHPSDANDYFITTYFRQEFDEWQAGRLQSKHRVIAPRPIPRAH